MHRVVLAAALLALSCTRKQPEQPPQGAKAPAARSVGNACDAATRLLSLAEAARYCFQVGLRTEVEGQRCVYRLAEPAKALVRITFAGKEGRTWDQVRKSLGPSPGRPAPTLGARGLVFYGQPKGGNTFLFEAGGEVFVVEGMRPWCEVGPLSRIARLVHERARLR